MDRHRAPAMIRDSICFGAHVDGACAVGSDRPKVLAVKATFDAAGLQCSEVEADTSRQVFTDHQLDHESGMLSLEASGIWRFRRGLEFASCQKQLAGKQVAKLIGHITWSCPLRRPAFVSRQCWVSCFTYLRTPKRTVVACSRAGIPMDRVIAAALYLQPCQSLVTVGLCYRCLGSYAPLV